MIPSLQKKREQFAKQIRSEKKQKFFQVKRKELLIAQQQENIDLEHLIMAEMVEQLGTEEQVKRMLYQYDQYKRSQWEFYQQVQEEEEASMNFERLQKQKQLEEEKKALLKLFEDSDEEQNNHPQDNKYHYNGDVQI